MASSAELAQSLAQTDAGYNFGDIYNNATTQLGIPDARARVTNLKSQIANTESALSNVDPSVTGRTSGALVTESQRQRLVNMERQPISDTYNKQNKAYGDESTNYNDLLKERDTNVAQQQDEYTRKRNAILDQIKFAQEQEAAQAAAEQAAQEAASRSSGGGGGGGGGSAARAPAYQKRSDGGFNFQGADGAAISARVYANRTGTDFNALLRTMAAQGDKGAADVLKNGAKSKYYHALTYGQV